MFITRILSFFLLISVFFVSCAKDSNDTVKKLAARKSVSDEQREYMPVVQDESTGDFISKKYASVSQSTWNCHDPKLFQDPVSGRYFVYSTGWTDGVQIRSSDDGIHWAFHKNCALWDKKDVSIKYRNMHWDDDFLKWVGYATNDGRFFTTKNRPVPQKPNSWAPAVVYQNGKYYMFHGIITDCLSTGDSKLHPAACITLAIAEKPEGPFIPASKFDPKTYKTSSLVRYVWTNNNAHNAQIGYNACYNTASSNWENGFGTIDPEFVTDIATGKLMEYQVGKNTCYALTYGSWKGGIALVFIDAKTFRPVNQKTGKVMNAPLDSEKNNFGMLVAGGFGAAYEGAQIIYNSETGYYYIFVSMGDLQIQYRVGVGRSQKLAGPYTDTGGNSMVFTSTGQASGYHDIGGKIIGAAQLGEGWGFSSPGGQSIMRDSKGRILFACHSRTNWMNHACFTLQLRQMYFNCDGWPVLNWNEFYGESTEHPSFTMKDIAGRYDSLLTRRSRIPRIDGTSQKSESIIIAEDGTVTGKYSGSVRLDSDGSTVVFDLGEIGVFTGLFLSATDWSVKNIPDSQRRTISFTALNSTSGKGKGEYFFGNKVIQGL